jgi:antitoxin (DNA-binding transcriptional repressor) of toxin-antitoxin stability system
MVKVNVQRAETDLSRCLDAAENGEVVVLCRNNNPVAELHPVPAGTNYQGTPRFGLWDGFGVPDSFFEPLPDDLVKAFSGG